MKRDSLTAMCVYGGLTGLLAWGLSALTGTGMAGLYAVSFLGMIAVPLYLMWPERNRFFLDRKVASRPKARRVGRTGSRRRRPHTS